MKKEYYYLIGILALAAGYRLYNLTQPYFIGNDSFLHKSVMRQALADGNLMTYELSFGNPLILEPKGFYLVTIIPAMLIGLDAAFLLIPILFGLIGIIFSYLLLKDLFDKRTGLYTALILAINLGHMYRSSPNTYRGDNLFLTIFLAILYFYNKRKNLTTGLLMGLSATLWGGYPVGILVIISGLIIEGAMKFMKNDYSKKDLWRAVMILAPYYIIEWLCINVDLIHSAFFTKNTGLHALLVFAPIMLGFFFLITKKFKKSNIMALLIGIGLILAILNFGTINSMIQEGLFEDSLFYEIGVTELLPPTPGLLNTMLSWTLYMMWPGLLIYTLYIVKKPTSKHLTYLLWIGVSTYLMLNYSRYTFIASITAASLSALTIDYVYTYTKKRNQKLAYILPLFFIIPYSIDSVMNLDRIGPRMNPYWEDALTWAGQNLEPGNVVTWWDHGSWVQYFAGLPTVVDSVNGQAQDRIKVIAQFLTTNKVEDFKTRWGAKYLILGSDVILYSGAIKGIAGVDQFAGSFIGPAVPATFNGETINVYPISDGRFEAYSDRTLFRNAEQTIELGKTFYANKSGVTVIDGEGQGCLLINPYVGLPLGYELGGLFFDSETCKSNYVKLMFGNGLDGYKELYRNDLVVIYEILN